jgi:hypothetical protein
MKNSKLLILAAIALSSGWQAAHAQREAPSRADRRAQRQQGNANLPPQQQLQNFEARFQERLKSATPEQRQQMIQMRAQVEERLRAQGIDPSNPADIQRMIAGAGGAEGAMNAINGMAAGGGRGGRGGGRGGRGGAPANIPLTPEQKDAQRRALMISSGIYDKNVQDDIIAFINAEEKAREPLLVAARAAAASLNGTVARVAALSEKAEENEQKVNASFTAYNEALAADKIRHEAALKSLDASIGYQSNPRLKAFLTLVGIIDNNALAIGGAPAIFTAPRNVPATPAGNANLPRQARTPGAAAAAETAPPTNVGGFGALPQTPAAEATQVTPAEPGRDA